PFPGWKKVSTGLEADPGNPFRLSSPSYDILADSPIEIGNQDIISFTAAGIPHEIAVYGGGNYDREKLADDFTRIIEELTAVFGENPCERYVFIVHFLPSGGGGLEHLNSTTLQFPRQALESEKGWTSFMSLAAHEYFHLWNVKRLRPIALGPFDYDRENYTHMLWVAEGFTAYYDNWIVRRTGFFSPEEYLQEVTGLIGTVENTPGNKVQAVTEASFDAWIKYYRPNENSYNTTISYYSKGAILGLMIDMAIRRHSGGKQSIDDLMSYLYRRFYKEMERGYKDEEFREAVEKFAGPMGDFFEKYVQGTDPIPYNDFFETVGLKLVRTQPYLQQAYLGAQL
ncbi:MAG TPA: peptidase M61, partial [Anseongella sp.]|nr:peptidase M61 [Anseongella sp.]